MMRWITGCIGALALCAALFGSNGADAAGPTWEYVSIGVAGGSSDSVDTVVSDDGTYCKYPSDFPIKAETEVRLRTEAGGDPLMSSLSTNIAETYPVDVKRPGDACAMWVQIDNVPMSDGYLIEIGSSPAGVPVPSSINELLVVAEFWTFDFTESIASDGGPTCEPTVVNAAMPGASIRANPAPLSSSDPGIVGIRTPSACNITFTARVISTDGVAVSIGDIPLPEEVAEAASVVDGTIWPMVEIGLGAKTAVSADGLYCEFPLDAPIKPGTEVRLRTEMGGVPTIVPLNNVIAETYPEGERVPGDACSIWARFFDVPISDGYLIEIGPDSGGDASTSSVTEMAVFVNFWTPDFTEKLEPDGRSTCDADTANGMKSGASFQTNVAGQSLSGGTASVIVGQTLTSVCRVSLHSVYPPAGEYAIAIGSISLPESEPQSSLDSLPAGRESTQSVPPAPIIGPEWLDGMVVRQLVAGEAEDSGIESLAFIVLAVDDESLVSETPQT